MDLAEYKQRKIKPVKLPSGLCCRIRKLSFGDIQEIGSENVIALGQEESNDDKIEKANKMIAASVVGPFKVVVKKPEETAENELSVYDFENPDYSALLESITKHSGLDGDSKKKEME